MFNLQIIPVGALQQNSCVIWDNHRKAAVIDPGADADRLIQFIESQQLELDKILITHGHFDHIGDAEKLKQHFNVEIWGSQNADQPLFEQLPYICASYGFSESPAFLPDHWLSEGDKISVGELQFEIKHLPGHSPGHIGFFDFNNKIAFTGDVLFQNGIGRTDLFMGNYEQLIDTIHTKLLNLDDDFIIMPGHGKYTTIGNERLSNPFLK